MLLRRVKPQRECLRLSTNDLEGKISMLQLRRLRFMLFLSAILLLGPSLLLTGVQSASAQTNPIAQENLNPGTSNWRIDYNNGGRISDDANNQIKGYASATSVNHGSTINLYVTVNPAQSYTIDVYRMGWYGGAGGRLMQSIPVPNGVTQPACPIDATTGMVECNWSVSQVLAVPANWTTGIYLAKLTNAQNYQSYIVFTVRDDNRVADFIYQQPVNTYQAYNNYPNNGTGKSLYDFNSSSTLTAYGTQRAVKVSFNRPYGGAGGPDGGGQFAGDEYWERYFISWAERVGYDISYTTDVDTHVNGARLLSFKGYLSVGHNEYWSKEMFDAVEAARNGGVNLAFFGANTIYWKVRYEPSSANVPNRVLVTFKSQALDPVTDPALKTDLWRNLGRAEQQLVGVQYTIDGDFSATQNYIIKNSNHWVWANTGFTDGSVVPGLLGYEVDRLYSQFPAPVGQGYTTLAESTYVATTLNPPISEISQSSIYQANSGAWVFAAGTMSWAWGLDRPTYVSTGIQQATQNILGRFLQGNVPPTSTPLPPTATSTNTLVPTATSTNTPIPTVTSTNTPIPTATSTNSPIPATGTPTNTPIPPTATPTNTVIPPTATPTATNTPIPPTATPTSSTVIDTSKTYKIISRSSGKLLSANPSMTAVNGQKIIQYSDVGATYEQWSFVSAGNGYYYVVSKQTGRVLDINNSSLTNGEQLQLWQLNNGANQQWRIVNANTAGYLNFIVRHSGLYMDVNGSGTTDFTPVIQWPGTGNPNQQWQLVEVVAAPTPTATPTPLTGTVDKRILQGSDDAEESKSSGTTTVNSADIELGYDLGLTNTYQWCGLRFQNITVPRGATITNAYIEFTTSEADSLASGSLLIRGQASDNPTTFTTSRSNISLRSRTVASVSWNNVPSWIVVGAKNSTPSLRTIVQELVNRTGWNSGNSMAFIIDGTGRHASYAYEGRASSAARLVIQWTSARSVMPDMPSDHTDAPTPEAQAKALLLEYNSVAPGSVIRVVGQHFAANSEVTLQIGSESLATLQTDEDGSFLYQLSTADRGEGNLTLSVADQPEVAATLQVSGSSPLYLPEQGEYPADQEASKQRVYLPLIAGGNQ